MIRIAAAPQQDTLSGADGRPHILLVLDQLPRTLGGGERIVLKIAALLPSFGFRVSILTFSIHPESAALDAPPCPIYLLPLERTWDLTALRAALELRRFLQQQEVRIVQTFFESSDLWAGFIAHTVPGTSLVWSRRDMGILRARKHRIGYRLMAGAPDAVFAVSDQVRRYSIEFDRIDPARVQTIHNGLDLAAWESPPVPAARERIVTTVGNIRRVKGHDLFVRAAAALAPRFPGVTFTIAGDVLEPDYFAELQALVLELSLGDRFRFAGGVADTRRHLAAADIFVLPSRSEGFSNAIIEAMAASLPVVATDVGGNAEAVLDGVNGFIVPTEDPAALAAAIATLLADPAKASAMGEAGNALAAQRFTSSAMMQRITGAYRSLIAQP
jgi:L-malate glycosyltransferase